MTTKSNRKPNDQIISRGLKQYLVPLQNFWTIFRQNRSAVVGLGILMVLILIAILTPLLVSYDPYGIYPETLYLRPSWAHPFGTDDRGRDILIRVMFGARVSLTVGFIAVMIFSTIGIVIGAFAGYYGGRVDDILMRFTDMVLLLPFFFLVLIIVALFGEGKGSMWILILVIGLVAWPGTARILRSEVLSIKEQEYVEAARVVGASNLHIIFRQILPNAIHPVVVNAALRVGGIILAEAGLGFLGLRDPNIISWGGMLNDAQALWRYYWWMGVFPGLAIFITVIAINLVGDGLNDTLNPRLRKR